MTSNAIARQQRIQELARALHSHGAPSDTLTAEALLVMGVTGLTRDGWTPENLAALVAEVAALVRGREDELMRRASRPGP